MMLHELVKQLVIDLTPQAEVKVTLLVLVASKETLTHILSEGHVMDLSDVKTPAEQLNSGILSKFVGISIAQDDHLAYGHLEVSFQKDVIMDGKIVYSTMTGTIINLRETKYEEITKCINKCITTP